VITLPRSTSLDVLRPRLQAMLEQEYEAHTEALAALLDRHHRSGVLDLDAASAELRRGLADIATALRRMAEGSYGTCEECAGSIEPDLLEVRPTVQYCRSCTPAPRSAA
jgi:RNA polymerase-binding transcription factor DksA